MTTLASQSQATHRMHAYSGPSNPIFLLYEHGRLRHEPLSLCIRSCVQQFYAPAGHGVQDGIQPACPRKPSRVHHRRQCVFSLPFSLCASLRGEGSLFIIRLTRKSHSRGTGKHAGIRKAPVWRRLPRRRPGPHWPTFIRVLAKRHFVRVLCRFDRRAQPKRQDVPREALQVLCRLYRISSFLSSSRPVPFWLTNVCTRICDLLVAGNLEDLIRHGLHALRETLQQDKELTTNNTSIGILGPGSVHEAPSTPVDFRILEGPPIEAYLQTMQPKEVPPPPASASATASGSAQPPAGGDDDVQMSE